MRLPSGGKKVAIKPKQIAVESKYSSSKGK
jgi:hypothetical protein